MGRTLKDLAKSMRARADAVETSASRLAVIGAKAAVEALVYVTPVDTSEHLSNWQVFIGSPGSDPLPPYFIGRQGSTQSASAREAIEQALIQLGRKQPGQRIFISNLGPAIVMLDQGWSSQFPGGFVPRAVTVFRVAIANAIKRGALFNEKVV